MRKQKKILEQTQNNIVGITGIRVTDQLASTLPGTSGIVARQYGPLMSLKLLEDNTKVKR